MTFLSSLHKALTLGYMGVFPMVHTSGRAGEVEVWLPSM